MLDNSMLINQIEKSELIIFSRHETNRTHTHAQTRAQVLNLL